jgi:hypothetical protein
MSEPVELAQTCLDCEQTPCKCAEWDEAQRRYDAEEAERQGAMAETMLDYLWREGSDGLLHRVTS